MPLYIVCPNHVKQYSLIVSLIAASFKASRMCSVWILLVLALPQFHLNILKNEQTDHIEEMKSHQKFKVGNIV